MKKSKRRVQSLQARVKTLEAQVAELMAAHQAGKTLEALGDAADKADVMRESYGVSVDADDPRLRGGGGGGGGGAVLLAEDLSKNLSIAVSAYGRSSPPSEPSL